MIDLYSSATPNGRKVTIMLEELGIKYNTININLDKKDIDGLAQALGQHKPFGKKAIAQHPNNFH